MKKVMVLFFLVFVCAARIVHAQQLDSLLDLYDKKVPQEKLHVHFDNSLYTPGQTVWYKAYLLKGLEPSELSKNLYIDWFDETGKLLKRTIAPVISATASGDFTIPQKYTGSCIQVMAYTKWMLNFDSSLLFHQTLSIAPSSALLNNRTALVPVTHLQFYPEGGDMVENISGNIAFKALNSAGMPVPVSGTIINRNREVITVFHPEHDGMGKFLFTPLPGELYTAEWKDPQENIRYTQLPVAKKTGVILNIKEMSVAPKFTIERSAVADDRFKKITIVGTMDQQVVFKAKATLADKTKITASLPALKFSSGVLQLTLFDNNMQPLAERVLFINHEEYRLQAAIYTDTLNLDKRGKNVYDIELADTIPASLSLSVTEGEGTYDSSQNIISQLLLSSEIKGHIYNPAYYFSSPDDSVANQLDLVMLTNGWRRFVWDDVLTGKTPGLPYAYDSGYLSLAGKVDKLTESKIKKSELMNLILVAKDSTRQFIFAPLHPDGSFRQDNLILFDTTKVYYKLNKIFIPARSHVNINNTFLPFDSTVRNHALAKYLPDTTGLARIQAITREQKKLDSLMRLTSLKEVIVKTKIKSRMEEMDEKYTSGLFQRGISRDFNIVDDPLGNTYQSAFAYLQSRVAGLQISNVSSLAPTVTRRRSPVSFFIDEMPVDVETLATLPMNDIAYIKVFDPPFIGAIGGGGGGAIAVYTKKGDDTKTMSIGLDFTLLPGYTPFKQFYSPNYAEKQMNVSQADFRRTLYWLPNLITDGRQKKIRVSFYNNDISHSLQIVLEGMAADGKLIHVSKMLK